MLRGRQMHAMIPAADLDRARQFYADKLGLVPTREESAGLVFETPSGGWFRLFPSSKAGTAGHTLAGWAVEDIEAEMAELRANGVIFEEYDEPGLRTVNGILANKWGRSAWFKDSEGNILSIAEPAG